MENTIDISNVERIELLTYEQLTEKQKHQVEDIASGLNSSNPDKLVEIMQKHYYFMVDVDNKNGEILHYAIKH
jgi:hypothetical protein